MKQLKDDLEAANVELQKGKQKEKTLQDMKAMVEKQENQASKAKEEAEQRQSNE